MTGTATRKNRPKHGSAARVAGKITPPTLHRVVTNKRLIARLDDAFAHRVVWVHGPPGAGKTTLVASYLASRKWVPLWYRLDEGDADPATVFLYLAAAAAHHDPARGDDEVLPLLTPELRGALPLFTRRFMRQLFALRPVCLVFDDYHEVAGEAPLHECLPHGLEEVPEGSNIVVVSRKPPPPQLARLRLNGVVDVIEPDALRITSDEALALARARDPQACPEHVARIAALTQGWAAGVILMLEAGSTKAVSSSHTSAPVPELLFDYFAGEVLARMPAQTRRLLAMLAIMPTTSAADALRLTGSPEAATVLEDLCTRNYFTVCDTGAQPHYRFHPLFRAFLLHVATTSYAPKEMAALRVRAAAVLDEDGQSDSAAGLLAEAEDFEALGDLFRRRAAALLDEGRFSTLLKWQTALPNAQVVSDPWLSYYAGESRVWSGKPEEALPHLSRAYELFAAANDGPGQYLAWAGQAEAVRLSPFGDQARFDPLIQTFCFLQENHPDIPPGRTTERVAFVMAIGLSRRGNAREEIWAWQQRALSAARKAGRPGGVELCAAMFACSDLHDAHYARALRHLEEIPEPLALAHLPFARLSAIMAHAIALLNRQKQGSYARYAEAAIAQSDAAGWTLWSHMIAGMAISDAFQRGDVGASGFWLERMRRYTDRVAEHRGAYYHYASAQHYLLAGDLALAQTHADEGVTIAAQLGWQYIEAIARATRCDVLLESGALDETEAELQRLEKLLARSATSSVAPAAGCVRADLFFARGNEAAGMDALRAAITLGRQQGNWRVSLGAKRGARLLARSLSAHIEPEYVREVIRRVGVPCPDPYDELWPRPIRIVTLGGFSVTVDDAPLTFSRKTPKRLIALLKAIATFGGRGVPEQKLVDALWPDDDGDAARSALTIAIHRLRKLLGDNDAILVSGGTVGFDARRCWLDAWTFEHLLPLGPDQSSAVIPRCERLFALYRGDFLAGDEHLPWTVARREQLRARFTKMVEIRAAMRGDSIAVLERGIEAAPKAEPLYQNLMRHHLVNGRVSEGLAVYGRLRKMLDEGEGTAPTPTSETLLERLRATSP